MHGYRAISGALAAWRGTFEDFIRQLDEDCVQYLSFSKLNTVQCCPQRYLLEYIERVEFEEPDYFLKGRLFHQAASLAYRQLGSDKVLKQITRLASKHFYEEEAAHILNAVRLLIENSPSDHEVVATELPFVLSLGSKMPPLIGVIDLLLRKGDTFIVVDHKTGRSFYPQDSLQLHLYREHVQREFKPKRCLAAFHEYRWVNNLDRIRKPAFRKTAVRPKAWPLVLRRVQKGWKAMQKIERTKESDSIGECISCPLKDVCPDASFDWQSSW